MINNDKYFDNLDKDECGSIPDKRIDCRNCSKAFWGVLNNQLLCLCERSNMVVFNGNLNGMKSCSKKE